MEPRTVLLVDDEDDIRAVGQIALEDVGGWRTLLAGSGVEAVEIALRERPDVVLLDVMMPGTDGPTTLGLLRGRPETAATPIIFLTAKVQKPEVARLLELGAKGVLAKPFDPMTLADDVRRVLNG
jgi:CheY-like chemotaxis protein